MPNYFNAFNVFECRRKLLDKLDVSYEKWCMATPKEEYFGEMLDHIIKQNHRHDTPMSNENLQEAVIRVMKDEEIYAKRNFKNVITDTLFQSPVTVNAQNKYDNVTYDMKIALGILAEIIKEFKGCSIKLIINYSVY